MCVDPLPQRLYPNIRPAPLRSYSKLSDKELLARLLTVCQAEGVAHTPQGLEAVVFTADGDMRQALNNLQVRGRGAEGPSWRGPYCRLCLSGVSAPASYTLSPRPSPSLPPGQATANGFGLVEPDAVFRVCDQPHPVLVGAVVKSCTEARIDDAYEGMKVGSAGVIGVRAGNQDAGALPSLQRPLPPPTGCTLPSLPPSRTPSPRARQALCGMGYSASDIIAILFRVVRSYAMNEYLKLEYIKVGAARGWVAWCGVAGGARPWCICICGLSRRRRGEAAKGRASRSPPVRLPARLPAPC